MTRKKSKNKEKTTNGKRKIVFEGVPFGMVTILKGQLGYKRKTRIRLRFSSKLGIYFFAKGLKYVQDKNNKKVFIRTLG